MPAVGTKPVTPPPAGYLCNLLGLKGQHLYKVKFPDLVVSRAPCFR